MRLVFDRHDLEDLLQPLLEYLIYKAAFRIERGTVEGGSEMSKIGGSNSKNPLYCSFCGKSQHEVRKLIAGPTVFICDECVELCMDIIGEENSRR